MLGDSQAIESSADTRVVVSRPGTFASGQKGSFQPRQVVCTEPSPDVAKIVSKSFNMSTALEAVVKQPEANADVAAKVAAAISKSQAEALAQLTSRLATIQLLRDGLYRACEAYANGALSPITYSVILSGYGDVMVTLLSGELVAGNFGQSLAVLGTQSAGAASAATKAKDDADKSQQAVRDAQTQVSAAQQKRNDAQKALDSCRQPPADGTPPPKCNEQETDLRNAQRDVDSARDAQFSAMVQAMGDVSAAASSQASATIAQAVGSASPGNDREYRAYLLADLQQRFLANVNKDSMAVACLSALAEPVGIGQTPPPLVPLCQEMLPGIVKAQNEAVTFQMRKDRPTAAIIDSCVAAIHKAAGSKSADLDAIVQMCNTNLTKAVEQEWNKEIQRATPPGATPAHN